MVGAEDDAEAAQRILSVRPPYLLATDVETGQLAPDFGDAGRVDLRVYADTPELVDYSWSSPPLVVRDVVIVGSAMADHPLTKEQRPGYVRAYDVRTGALRWPWNPIPRAGEPGVETWLDDSWEYSGMANVWTMMSADEEIGLIYLPTGAPTNDMYGGHRPGNNLFANSLVCVRAETGEQVWHFQMVHHDLWDYDNNVAPILMDITVDGREIKAVVQLTKQAIAYVFDRVTGEPVWPIVERPVPGSKTPGEWISPTQPFPTKPAPFDVHGISVDTLIDLTPELREEAMEIAAPYVLGEIFTPPSIRGDGDGDRKGTLQLPGSVGGAEWGGAGFDPKTGMLYVPSVTGTFAADLTPGNPDRMNVRYTRGTRAFPLGPQGLPLLKPPYGRITAIDMNTGEHVWMVPNGDGLRDHPAIAHLNLPPLGLAWPCDDVADREPAVRQRGRPDHGQDATRRRTRRRQEVSRFRQGVGRGRLGDDPPGRQHRVANDLHARWQAVHRAADRLAGQGRGVDCSGVTLVVPVINTVTHRGR